jgi:hypothetical protein
MHRFALAVMSLAACGDNFRLRSDALPPSGDAALVSDAAGDAAVGASDGAIDAPADASPCCNDGATSGTRLKLVWYVTQDGVKVFRGTGNGYYDTQRSEDCLPNAWSDGNTCRPCRMDSRFARTRQQDAVWPRSIRSVLP